MSNTAVIIMSFGMLKRKFFDKVTSYLGIGGNTLLIIYVLLKTLALGTKSMATALAMPGGIMAMA